VDWLENTVGQSQCSIRMKLNKYRLLLEDEGVALLLSCFKPSDNTISKALSTHW